MLLLPAHAASLPVPVLHKGDKYLMQHHCEYVCTHYMYALSQSARTDPCRRDNDVARTGTSVQLPCDGAKLENTFIDNFSLRSTYTSYTGNSKT